MGKRKVSIDNDVDTVKEAPEKKKSGSKKRSRSSRDQKKPQSAETIIATSTPKAIKKPKKSANKSADDRKPKLKQLFNGKLFACTTKGDDGDADSDDQRKVDGPAVTYSQIKELVEGAGGKISSLLHKRVFALIATDRATCRRTQRVRKALKYDIPIVSTDFVTKSLAAKQCLNVSDFVLDVAPETEAESAKRVAKEQSGKARELLLSALQDAPQAKVVDLGCCCSCHDSGKLECDWCTKHHEAA